MLMFIPIVCAIISGEFLITGAIDGASGNWHSFLGNAFVSTFVILFGILISGDKDKYVASNNKYE